VIALDANVLARYYAVPGQPSEEAEQRRAAALLASERALFVPVTVALELAWVLIGRYECDPPTVAKVFDHLLSLPNVTTESAAAVAQAAAWHRKGLDFADALHLARCGQCTELASFDRKRFANRAGRLGLKPAVRVP